HHEPVAHLLAQRGPELLERVVGRCVHSGLVLGGRVLGGLVLGGLVLGGRVLGGRVLGGRVLGHVDGGLVLGHYVLGLGRLLDLVGGGVSDLVPLGDLGLRLVDGVDLGVDLLVEGLL